MVVVAGRTDVDQRVAEGRAARAEVARGAHAAWDPARRTRQPLELLAEQDATRVPELIPIRYGRMAASPFAYYRGAALPMAADLATGPRTGLDVQLCGDAHLSNFGGFASPERAMLFDVNDFDETLPGPFEWDLKRLAASLEVAGRERGFSQAVNGRIVTGALDYYRRAIRDFARRPLLDVWYARMDIGEVLERWGAQVGARQARRVRATVERARRKDQIRARAKLTRRVGAELRFVSDPPLLVPVSELLEPDAARALTGFLGEAIGEYRRTLSGDRRRLLESYRVVDLARKVVGVGSVGTRAWVALLVGRNEDDTLILQIKEAEASVMERFLGASRYAQHGERVVEGQRLMQASTDIFLGWQRMAHGVDGRSHDYYIRQLWDWKLSADVAGMDPQILAAYAQMCAWTLARAHARSGDAVAIGAYLGGGNAFPSAVTAFARAYADQNETDHAVLVAAIAAGTVPAEMDV